MTRVDARWSAIAAARDHDPATRLPFFIGEQLVGSVAPAHLPALAAWPRWMHVEASGVLLLAPSPDDALATINRSLREQGLILAWRDEPYAVHALQGGQRLARIERASSRFWGTLSFGAHATGYLRGADGRPSHLWIARRSLHKATDPGLLDNLIGGGVPDGQTPRQALLREGWEEAGLDPGTLERARPGRVIHLLRNIPEGLQREDLHSFDLELSPSQVPVNQDGEVQTFECMPVPQALALAASTEMTVDAALVTLDFALRHGLAEAPPGTAALFEPP